MTQPTLNDVIKNALERVDHDAPSVLAYETAEVLEYIIEHTGDVEDRLQQLVDLLMLYWKKNNDL